MAFSTCSVVVVVGGGGGGGGGGETIMLFDYWIFHNRSLKIIGQEVSIDDRL